MEVRGVGVQAGGKRAGGTSTLKFADSSDFFLTNNRCYSKAISLSNICDFLHGLKCCIYSWKMLISMLYLDACKT